MLSGVSRIPVRRTLIPIVVAAAVLAVDAGAATAAPGHASRSAKVDRAVHLDVGDSRLLADVNLVRARAGMTPLRANGSLNTLASRWSQVLARQQILEHNPRLATQMKAVVPGWKLFEENVGATTAHKATSAADSIFADYMASPMHRSNLLNPKVHVIGVGTTASKSGIIFNVVDLEG